MSISGGRIIMASNLVAGNRFRELDLGEVYVAVDVQVGRRGIVVLVEPDSSLTFNHGETVELLPQ